MDGNVAVLGDFDFVMPFSALGLDTYAVTDNHEQQTKTAKEIIEKKYALILVAEDIAEKVQDVFQPSQNKALPCIIVMPFTKKSSGYAKQSLGEALRMATGVDILKNA
jgi:vacuolar-type H+-ATPase subunit F/Vma7